MINWQIETTGNLPVTGGSITRVQNDDAIVQNLRATLYHVLKEWFLDIESGIDYKGQVLTKVFDPVKACRVIQRGIKNALGISSIESFSLEKDGNVLNVIFAAVTENGTTIRLNEVLQI